MRTVNSIRNAVTAVINQIIILLLNFISRKIFLEVLSIEYLGISSLFSSIITMLSLAELGIGTAITFSLYKPLAEKQEEVIIGIMKLFRRIYMIIGFVIIIIGILITPIVMNTIKLDKRIESLNLIYILFVLNSGISYFFSYSRTLIAADQKEYKLAIIDNICKILSVFFQSAFLIITSNYILYLIIQIIMTIIQNYMIYIKVNKNYTYLKSNENVYLPNSIKSNIKKNTFAMVIYKSAIVSVSGADNIIISSFLGTAVVGMYSNYYLVVSSIQTIVGKLISAVTASIGNTVAVEDEEKSYDIFERMQYICFWIFGFCSVSLYILLPPFIKIFFGKEYLLSNITLIIIIINFYLLGMQSTISVYRDALGLFNQGKFRPLFQGVLNIVISILLVKKLNSLSAVFLGTVISRVLTITWYDPYIVHKYGFNKLHRLFNFWCKYIKYLILTLTTMCITYFIATILNRDDTFMFIYKIIICILIPNFCFLFTTYKMKEYQKIKYQIKLVLLEMRKFN